MAASAGTSINPIIYFAFFSKIENGSGYDVLVMDEQSIKHFNSDGILHKEYLKMYAKKCRGLDLWNDYLVTSELTRHDLKLALVNLKTGQMERYVKILKYFLKHLYYIKRILQTIFKISETSFSIF